MSLHQSAGGYGALHATHETKTNTSAAPAFSRRIGFWGSAGLSWLVWIFAVAASVDDHWLKLNFWGTPWWFDYRDVTGFGPGSDHWLDFCDIYGHRYYAESFCGSYDAFTAMQFLATLLCSVGVLVISVAFFRPESALWGSVGSLAFVGAIFMALYAVFQLLAFVLVAVIRDSEVFEYLDITAKEGHTFWVGVVGFIFGVADSMALFFFRKHGGDGPLYCYPPSHQAPPPQAHVVSHEAPLPQAYVVSVTSAGVSATV